MNFPHQFRIFRLAIIPLFLLCSMNCKTQVNTSGSLDERLGDVPALQDVTIQRALLQVLSAAHISGGIVETSSCAVAQAEAPKHSFILAGLSVRQALDMIIEEDLKYEWSYDGKVINILPVAGLPEILKTKVHHFQA